MKTQKGTLIEDISEHPGYVYAVGCSINGKIGLYRLENKLISGTGKEKGNGGKCAREVVFLLDEFGNILPIPEMSNILNV